VLLSVEPCALTTRTNLMTDSRHPTFLRNNCLCTLLPTVLFPLKHHCLPETGLASIDPCSAFAAFRTSIGIRSGVMTPTTIHSAVYQLPSQTSLSAVYLVTSHPVHRAVYHGYLAHWRRLPGYLASFLVMLFAAVT